MTRSKRRPEDLTIAEVEKAIDLKAEDWHGNCYAVSIAILRAGLVEGVPRYGHYYGPVSPNGFWKSRVKQPFMRHGWIELNDGRVFDATRWSFENKPPYLHIADDDFSFQCQCDHVEDEHERGFFSQCTLCDCPDYEERKSEYDPGGNRMRAKLVAYRPMPVYDPKAKRYRLKLSNKARIYLKNLVGNPPHWNHAHLIYLANLAIDQLGLYAEELYKALVEIEQQALIPIDNRQFVLGEAYEHDSA